MSIHLERKDLINTQQMEIEVNGPDGANHLIICTGVVALYAISQETYTFLVGPHISRRQFVGAIASGALSTIQCYGKNSDGNCTDSELGANLGWIDADYDGEFGQVKVRAEVTCGNVIRKLAVSYNVSILAELPTY